MHVHSDERRNLNEEEDNGACNGRRKLPVVLSLIGRLTDYYDGIYRTKMKLFLLGPRWTTLDHLRSCWTTFEHLG